MRLTMIVTTMTVPPADLLVLMRYLHRTHPGRQAALSVLVGSSVAKQPQSIG